MLRIGVREQLKSPHPSWIPEIIIRPSNYAEKLHKCCQDLQPSRPPDVCCDREKHSRSFHHRLPALLYFENHKRTTWYLNLNNPMCSHSAWCTAHCPAFYRSNRHRWSFEFCKCSKHTKAAHFLCCFHFEHSRFGEDHPLTAALPAQLSCCSG